MGLSVHSMLKGLTMVKCSKEAEEEQKYFWG